MTRPEARPWRAGDPPSAENDPYITGLLEEVLPASEHTRFLDTGHPQLDGDTPRSRTESGCPACRGTVIDLLVAMAEGVPL